MNKVVFAGASINDNCLEASYKRAFQHLGFEVHWFDTVTALAKYVPLGRLGTYVNDFIGIQAWIRKMQRELAVHIRSLQPSLVIVFCNAKVHYNVLALLKSTTRCKLVLLWPDTVFNLEPHVSQCAPFYDGVATYSSESKPLFEALGFQNVQWVPLAADEELHGCARPPDRFELDLCFIGNARAERARDLGQIVQEFPSIKMRIWGGSWNKRRYPALRPYIVERHILGREFAHAMNSSRISLNVIDETNYPAANMRFFETPIAHSLQLASVCPEWEHEYLDMKHLAYYRSATELFEKIEGILANDVLNLEIRREGHHLTKTKHTYRHRAQSIINYFL